MAQASPTLTIKYQTAYGETPKTIYYMGGYEDFDFNGAFLPVLEADDMIFKGWSYNGEIISAGYKFYFDEDTTITLIAVWEEQKTYVIAEKSDIVAIADAIRAKDGSTDGMTIDEMPEKIATLETGGTPRENCIVDLTAKMPCIVYSYYDSNGELIAVTDFHSHTTQREFTVAKDSILTIHFYQTYDSLTIEGDLEEIDTTTGNMGLGNYFHMYLIKGNCKINAPRSGGAEIM